MQGHKHAINSSSVWQHSKKLITFVLGNASNIFIFAVHVLSVQWSCGFFKCRVLFLKSGLMLHFPYVLVCRSVFADVCVGRMQMCSGGAGVGCGGVVLCGKSHQIKERSENILGSREDRESQSNTAGSETAVWGLEAHPACVLDACTRPLSQSQDACQLASANRCSVGFFRTRCHEEGNLFFWEDEAAAEREREKWGNLSGFWEVVMMWLKSFSGFPQCQGCCCSTGSSLPLLNPPPLLVSPFTACRLLIHNILLIFTHSFYGKRDTVVKNGPTIHMFSGLSYFHVLFVL